MAIKEGAMVAILLKYDLGGCIGTFLGAHGDTAYVDIPVTFFYGETTYDFEVPMKALLELPLPKNEASHG